MFAGAVLARRFVDDAGVAGLVVFGVVRELLELVLDFVPLVVVLPPAGWATAELARMNSDAAATSDMRN